MLYHFDSVCIKPSNANIYIYGIYIHTYDMVYLYVNIYWLYKKIQNVITKIQQNTLVIHAHETLEVKRCYRYL